MSNDDWDFPTATREDLKYRNDPLAGRCSCCKGWRPLVYVNPRTCESCALEQDAQAFAQELMLDLGFWEKRTK